MTRFRRFVGGPGRTPFAAMAALVATLGALSAFAPGAAAQTAVPRDPGVVPGDPGAVGEVSLEEVYELVRERNPGLRAASAMAAAAEAREASAGLPPDPTLQAGVMNVSLPGLDADMPASMAPSIQAMQKVPFPGKLGLSEAIAEQSTAMARAGADERWWEVRSAAGTVFFTIYEIDEKLAVMRETLGLLRDFQQVAQAMYAAGTGRQSDVLRATVEVARTDAEIQKMVAMRKVAAARLNALLDRPAATPVPRAVLPPLPAAAPTHGALLDWAEETRPMLIRSRTGVERSATSQELAHRQIWPDLSLGVQYGQREAADGTSRMGSAMVGFSVPIFAKSRQLRQRDEAAAMRAVAEAELSAARAEVDARIGELLAELDRVRTLMALYREEILPQAGATVESAFSAYRVGTVDFMTLVDAQMTANRYEQEFHTLVADYGRAITNLERAVGRELPAGTDIMAEAR